MFTEVITSLPIICIFPPTRRLFGLFHIVHVDFSILWVPLWDMANDNPDMGNDNPECWILLARSLWPPETTRTNSPSDPPAFSTINARDEDDPEKFLIKIMTTLYTFWRQWQREAIHTKKFMDKFLHRTFIKGKNTPKSYGMVLTLHPQPFRKMPIGWRLFLYGWLSVYHKLWCRYELWCAVPRRVHAEGEQHDPVLLWQLDRHDTLVQRR